jgi:hypothetical protein
MRPGKHPVALLRAKTNNPLLPMFGGEWTGSATPA